MFSKKRNLLFIYVFSSYVELHMFFVFFDVDAVFLNKDWKILEIKHMKPFRPYYKSKHKIKYVLELTEEHNFKVGDKLKLKDNMIIKEV
jgi:uncharacterized membrane protein (UPF0127 family)